MACTFLVGHKHVETLSQDLIIVHQRRVKPLLLTPIKVISPYFCHSLESHSCSDSRVPLSQSIQVITLHTLPMRTVLILIASKSCAS